MPEPPSLWRAVGWFVGWLVIYRVTVVDLPPEEKSNLALLLFMLWLFGYATILILTDRGER